MVESVIERAADGGDVLGTETQHFQADGGQDAGADRTDKQRRQVGGQVGQNLEHDDLEVVLAREPGDFHKETLAQAERLRADHPRRQRPCQQPHDHRHDFHGDHPHIGRDRDQDGQGWDHQHHVGKAAEDRVRDASVVPREQADERADDDAHGAGQEADFEGIGDADHHHRKHVATESLSTQWMLPGRAEIERVRPHIGLFRADPLRSDESEQVERQQKQNAKREQAVLYEECDYAAYRAQNRRSGVVGRGSW